MKILVVEDDRAVAQILQFLFSTCSYAVDVAADGEAGLQMVDAYEYDLIVLDVMLPGLDGISVCQQLRAKGLKTPILLLTGQEGGRHKAIALNAGADDYVVKPFDTEELIARVQALLRRGGPTSQPVLTWGHLSIDPSTRKVAYGTQLLSVTPKEYAILELFLRTPQKALSSRVILNHVWTSLESPGEEAVRVHIKELRQKLTAVGAPKDFIQTKHRVGYQLNSRYSNLLAVQVEQQPTAPQIAELAAINEELRLALEELRTTQEELRHQNEQLEAAQQTIELERQRYRDLFEMAPDAYLVTNVYGVIQEANCAASDLFQIEPQQLLGKPLIVFIAQSDRRAFRLRLIDLNFVQNWEVNVKPREGDAVPVLVAVTSIKNLQNERVGLRWLLRDIRPRKEMEQQLQAARDELEMRVAERTAELVVTNQSLQQQQEQWQALFERALDAIAIIDDEGRYVEINPAACEIFGASREEILRSGIANFAAPTLESDRVWQQFLHQGKMSGELTLYRPDGTTREIEFNAIANFLPGRHLSIIRDISQRKQAEVALQKSEEKFRHFAENSHAVLWLADPILPNNLYVSPSYERIWGRSCQSLIERPDSWLDAVHPDDRERVQVKLTQQRQGNTSNVEYRIVQPDGTLRWIWDRGFAIRNEAGQVYLYGGIAEDISDRKQTELALRQREEFLRSIYEGADQAIFVIEVTQAKDFRYLAFNQKAQQYAGVSQQDIQDKTPAEVFGAVLGAILRQNYQRCLQAGTTITYEENAVVKTHTFWALTTLSPLRNEQGEIYRMVGTTIDISDRKQLELSLQVSEAKLSRILNSAIAAIASFRVYANRDWEYEYWSAGCERLYGYALEDYADKHFWLSQVVPEDRDQILMPLFDNFFAEQDVTAEYRFRRKDGSLRWFSSSYSSQKIADNCWIVTTVNYDITDRKQAEVALQQEIQQEYLLADIAQDIRRSLNLNEVLSRTVERVREVLNCDRVIIYRFQPNWQGDVVMESVGEGWTSILSTTIYDPCFEARFIELYQQGRISVTTDIDQAELEPCYVELLQLFQVKANLVAPILQGEQLWGLLIVHHCAAPRQWQPTEIELLRRLANKVGIAVQQSQLYEQTRRELLARVQMQTVLEESEERFRSLSAAAPIGILQTNADGICLYTNTHWQEISGFSLEDSLGNGWLQAIHPEDRETFYTAWEACLQHEREGLPEFRLLTPDGEIRWVSAQFSTIKSAGDEIIGYVSTYADISDRKQAELEIRKFVALADNSSEFIGMCDMNCVPFYLNQAGKQMVGLEATPTLSAISVQDCFFPEDQDFIIHEFFPRVLRDGRAEVEIRFRHFQTGEAVWMIYSAICIRDEKDEPIALATISRNISDRKQAELALQESEARFRLMANHAPVLIWVSGIDGKSSFFNQAWLNFTGQLFDEEIDDNAWEQVIHPDDVQYSVQTYLSAFEARQPLQMEYRLRRADGEYRWIEDRGVPRFTANGEFMGFIGSAQDIHDRKLAEVALQESEQRLQAILDNSPAVIYLIDSQNRYLLVNRSYAELHSTTPEQLLGKSLYEFWSTDIADALVAPNHTVLETGQLLQIEESLSFPDGQHTYITVKFPLCDALGISYAVCSISTDITEKKHLESQFYRAQRLESLGTLASGIAHDLNNVLTPILTISQLLRLHSSHLDARSQEMLNVLESSAKRGATMIKQILTFARGTGGEHSPLQITVPLQETIEIIQQTFPKSIDICQNIPDQSLWLVTADATYLHQVLMNLCVNARDAMPNGGILSISVEHCFVDRAFAQANLDAQVGNYVVITIADTGTGISPDVRDRIFEPFFTTKEPGQGTGLGLATVLGIVKEYGGFLQVFSEVGQGTQVKVYLPAIEEGPILSEPLENRLEGNGELILIVDDDIAVQRSIQLLLESHHYSVLSTNDGLEAIALYDQHQAEIKAVILDIMMPTMSGIVLIQRLKEMNPTVKIIAMSGLLVNREPALAAGASAFLPKPYTLENLLENLT